MATLTFTPLHPHAGEPCVSLKARVAGLSEFTRYSITTGFQGPVSLYIDDVELLSSRFGYAWQSDFYVGEVLAHLVDAQGREHSFYLEVVPSSEKLRPDQFKTLIDEVHEFDSSLLLGQSAASLGFSRTGKASLLESLVRFHRLRQYGHQFLAALEHICSRPHQSIQAAEGLIPLSQARLLSHAALRDRRLVALASGLGGDMQLEDFKLPCRTAMHTVDTQANRTLKALVNRFYAALDSSKKKLSDGRLAEDDPAAECQRSRRVELLSILQKKTAKLLGAYPLKAVTRADATTAAGLTQIAAHPLYARAYRLGTAALNLNVGGSDRNDALACSASWGAYEAWCFVKVCVLLTGVCRSTPCSRTSSPTAAADLCLAWQLSDGREVELLFQAIFPAEKPNKHNQAWSISRERRPDLVVVMRTGEILRTLVLDAKYRRKRANILDAMSSAHIYHDSLRVGHERPELALLLAPGEATVQSLTEDKYWQENGVGLVASFEPAGQGIARLATALAAWLAVENG